ncbi:MAG: hypothetical protein EZS28_024469 [Streblomastix strix]|uniref:Uncharacterized protein n=1 Tax=Streblomastix strix TaxID=222440 RepID=A0A5J4VC07_9EUKA|nr:MAG: hypothetical protein EZS28_024469 [Streblomastix strix]
MERIVLFRYSFERDLILSCNQIDNHAVLFFFKYEGQPHTLKVQVVNDGILMAQVLTKDAMLYIYVIQLHISITHRRIDY